MGIGYYLRSLPLQWQRGVISRLYRYLTASVLCIGVFLTYTTVLWTISAIYFDQAYVLNIIIFYVSAATFIFNAASHAEKYAKVVQKKVEQVRAETRRVLGEADQAVSLATKTGKEMQTEVHHFVADMDKAVLSASTELQACNRRINEATKTGKEMQTEVH